MPRLSLNKIFNKLREEVDNTPISRVKARASFVTEDPKRKVKNELQLPSILKPVEEISKNERFSSKNRPIPSGEIQEFVSEEFTTSRAVQVEEYVDILESSIDFTLNVVDEISVETPDIRNIVYPQELRGGDFLGYDVDFEIKFETLNTSYVEVGVGSTKNVFKTSDGGVKFNVKDDILKHLNLDGTEGIDKIKIPIQLTPFNTKGRKPVEGKTESITILFDKGDLEIPRSTAINRLLDGFINQITEQDFNNSKYLTHLTHFGDGDNKIISNWASDTSDGGLILKLYEPLPPAFQPNQKLWISKLQSQPLIETVTLISTETESVPTLRGPKFDLEADNGIGYQIYDNLLASGSATSTNLVNEYTNTVGIDTTKLSIEYASASVYTFDNFIRFGSAEERIKNFWYKLQLIETYQERLSDLTPAQVQVGVLETEDGYVLITENDIPIELDALVITQQSQVQAQTITDNINSLIRGFDGFEKFLYTSNHDKSYPKTNNVFDATTTQSAQSWYNSSVNEAYLYDKYNVNYLVNNVPEYLREDTENEEYLLFLDMISQHFDTLWVYINGIANSKKVSHTSLDGIPNTLVSHMLESLGWDKKRAYDSQYLWEYSLGLNKDGSEKYDRSLKDANEEIWRRILNNLPYLLKHKGTKRSLKAILASYGIPQSLLTIMEFGGPKDPTQGGTTSFTFEDRTSALKFSGSQYFETYFSNEQDITPNTIEMNLKFDERGNHGLVYLTDNSDIYFKIEANQTTGSRGKVKFSISASGAVQELESSELQLFNDTYKQIVLTRTIENTDEIFDLYVKEAKGDRLRINDVSTLTITSSTEWDAGDVIKVGGSGSSGLVGSIDEFRLWSTPLNSSVITNHAKIPDAINGNHYSASSTELLLRHDFEYPKNRNSGDSPEILNVAIFQDYVDGNGNSVTQSLAIGFGDLQTYPYSHEMYERSVTAQVPSMGFSVADKIRFEDQTLVGNLSHKVRATKKSFDQAPIDSPKLGLFFSPTKELNMDILKSFGNFNIDNYIGDPRDEYNDKYGELDTLREYYFERINLNVQEYIQLVRGIDKSLFDVLADLVPARAKVAKGLLIEPHILERSKHKWTRPESEKGDYETEISVDDNNEIELTYDSHEVDLDIDDSVTFEPSYDTLDAEITDTDDITLVSEYLKYEGNIDENTEATLESEYPTYEASVDASITAELAGLANVFDFTFVGQDDGGFGLYGEDSHGIVTELDLRGNLLVNRQQIYGVYGTEKLPITIWGDPFNAGAYAPYTDYRIVPTFVIAREDYPYNGPNRPRNLPGGKTIDSKEGLNGYFPSHYKFVKNHSEGFERSFFKGSKQTIDTTVDGLSPVETFTTNPNILKVADTGRGSGEPILEVD